MSTVSADGLRVQLIEAVVHAGEVVTPYLRAGRGAPLVFITQRDRAALEADPLVEALAARFCVIVPLLPSAAVADCLRCVLEGLGLDEARIIVEPAEALT